jgi:hypothetical protein
VGVGTISKPVKGITTMEKEIIKTVDDLIAKSELLTIKMTGATIKAIEQDGAYYAQVGDREYPVERAKRVTWDIAAMIESGVYTPEEAQQVTDLMDRGIRYHVQMQRDLRDYVAPEDGDEFVENKNTVKE